jgi:hypothetical protein
MGVYRAWILCGLGRALRRVRVLDRLSCLDDEPDHRRAVLSGRRRAGWQRAVPTVGYSLERVDPAVETARFAGEDVWIAEGIGEQRASFICGDEAYGEVMGVSPTQCPELLLGPLDGDAHQLR